MKLYQLLRAILPDVLIDNFDIVSIDNTKFSEFDLQKLEERLETDSLAVGGLLDLNSDIDLYGHCTGYTCPGMSCESYDW